MRRRDFIKAIAGSAAAWPLTVRAQQGDRMRRLGIIIGAAAEESETKARITAFLQELKHLGWDEGRNIRIEMRATAGNAGAARKYAAELVAFAPDEGAHRLGRCLRQLTQCQLYSRLPLIRLGTGWSIVWRDRAAMRLVL
jgi:hypothetical protein